MRLDYDIVGPIDSHRPPSRPLVLLHGFTGNRDSFRHLHPVLAANRVLVLPDLPGHAAPAAMCEPAAVEWQATVRALGKVLDEISPDPIDLLGYSLGGRLALGCAVARPHRIRHLVLESASPGLRDAKERAARRAADEVLAQKLEHDGLEGFVAQWERQSLFASLSRHLDAAQQSALASRRRAHTAAGLAAALRGLGLGSQPSYWDDLARLALPVLLVTGGDDAKFTAIGQAMTRLLPLGEHAILEDCGHLTNLENTATYGDLIIRFLDT
jgi:2-succinyl-6-hydroxy-2,4-cyclohexadiene-1-carboxylate synthase